MFENLIDSLRVLSQMFFNNPIPFTIGTIIAVTLIYYKWVWIGRIQTNTIKKNYAGWKVDGTVDSAQRLVLKPVKMLRTGIGAFLFFFAGFLFFALVEVPRGEMDGEGWFAFVAMGAFSLLALWVIFKSFTRITFDGEVFTQSGPIVRTMAARADTLQDIRPIGKTIAGGIFLDFGDQGRIRVASNMSGYRQLLEILTQHNLKLRMLVKAYSDAAKRHL